MKRNILVAIIVMFLLSPIYSMSDDGENVPVVQKENSSKGVPQVEQQSNLVPDQDTGAKYNETVKDEFGIDTGMSKVELQKFKEDYIKLDRKMFPGTQTDMLFNFKVDLNKYDEFLKLGLDLKKSGSFIDSKNYLENSLYSEIVVIGITIGQTKEKSGIFILEVQEILKGSEILIAKFGEIPKLLYYYCDENAVGTTMPVLNHKGMFFLWNSKRINTNRNWFQKRDESTLLLLPDSTVLYEKHYDDLKSLNWLRNKKNKSEENKKWQKGFEDTIIMNETWEEAVNNVKAVLKTNDAVNFYRKTFKEEVEK
ncbi:MAG: hypothetical protein JXQ26_07980 [Tissierellales bacterium]|nr:hypothetical protein [Tissierellales bacterium]